MDQTIRRFARVLGASGIEGSGADARFVVEGADGSVLQTSIEGSRQRVMAVLKDASGVVRATLDVGPVMHVTEDKAHPHRVTLHVQKMRVQIDSAPTLAIELLSDGEM